MKKILSIILAAGLILSLSVTSAFAATFSDVGQSDSYYSAVEALAASKILVGYTGGTFKPDGKITRAEITAVIVRMLKLESYAEAEAGRTDYFDVPADHWASGYINVATDNEIIMGDGDGYFRPEDDVLYEEAVKMVVEAAGYGALANKYGGWPDGYVSVGNTKGITDNFKFIQGSAAPRSSVALMVYQAMKGNKVTVAAPVASYKGGSYSIYPRVVLKTATEGAEIYYTVNGTTPTINSKKYTTGISVTGSQTIKAIAVLDGIYVSDVMTEVYSIAARGKGSSTVSYPVTLNLNYENAESEIVYVGKNKLMAEPEAPERTGYDFDGWFTDAGSENAFDFEETMVTEAFVLYAGWTENATEPEPPAEPEPSEPSPEEPEIIPEPEPEAVITVDMSDFVLNGDKYEADKKIAAINGTVNNDNITAIDYKVYDPSDTVCLEGSVPVAEKSFKVENFGLSMGTNKLVLTAKASNGSEISSVSFVIDNESPDNIYNTNADKNDDDGDKLINYLEDYYGTDKTKADTDGDGLSDYDEIYTYSTNPLKADTDNDGVNDKTEIDLKTNPLSSDTDTDGLDDFDETAVYKTDPLKADTDEDTLSDYDEVVIYKTNPLVKDNLNALPISKEIKDEAFEALVTMTAKQVDFKSVSITKAENNAAGTAGIGGITVSGNGTPGNIKLNITYTGKTAVKAGEFVPALYSFKDGVLTEVAGQTLTEKRISAVLPSYGTYVLIDKIAYEKALNEAQKAEPETSGEKSE